MITFLGWDIGGTKCSVLLAQYDKSMNKLHFMDKISFPTDQGHKEIIARLVVDSKEILVKNNVLAEDIESVGINCGGPLNSKEGIILCPPNLLGWVDIPIVAIAEKELGIKAYLQNDAKAGAIAEMYFGAGRGYQNIMFLTHGTGMGCGMILDGDLYCGTNDMAGEVGHIRLNSFGPVGFGKSGSFEGFCSGGGIAQLGKIAALEKLQIGELTGFCKSLEELTTITAKSIAEAADQGDKTANEVFQTSGHFLGQAISLFIDILNPEVIILGSIYSRCEHLLSSSIQRVVEKETIPFSRDVCKIVQTGLGEEINDYEPFATAIYEWKK